MYRIYAIIYTNHFLKFAKVAAVAHLNTSFKHYLYFIWEYNIVESKDLEVLKDLYGDLRKRFEEEEFL